VLFAAHVKEGGKKGVGKKGRKKKKRFPPRSRLEEEGGVGKREKKGKRPCQSLQILRGEVKRKGKKGKETDAKAECSGCREEKARGRREREGEAWRQFLQSCQ